MGTQDKRDNVIDISTQESKKESVPVPVLFQFERHQIRAIQDKGGNPWFVAKDICDALSIANSRDAVDRLDDDEKGVVQTDTLGGPQKVTIINEPGLYNLILRSDKPEAKTFKRWVTHEVLPALRKTGAYAIQETKTTASLTPASREFRAALSLAKMVGLEGNQAILSANNAVRKIVGTDCLEILGATHLIAETQVIHFTSTQLGQRLGMSAKKFNDLLTDKGLIRREDGAIIPTEAGKPYTVILDTGKKHSNGVPVQQVKFLETILDLVSGETSVH